MLKSASKTYNVSKVDKAIPYLDNAVNLASIASAPKVPALSKYKTPRLRFNYDVNPMMQQIDINKSASNKIAKRNIAHGGVRSAAMAVNNANATLSKNKILTERENKKQDFDNKRTLINNEIINKNIDLENAQKQMQVNRKEDIRSSIRGNAANLVEDYSGSRLAERSILSQKIALMNVAATEGDKRFFDIYGEDVAKMIFSPEKIKELKSKSKATNITEKP